MMTDDDDFVEWDIEQHLRTTNSNKSKKKLKKADQTQQKEKKPERKRRAVTDSQESVPSEEINDHETNSDSDFREIRISTRKFETPAKKMKIKDKSEASKYEVFTGKHNNSGSNNNNTNKFNTSSSNRSSIKNTTITTTIANNNNNNNHSHNNNKKSNNYNSSSRNTSSQDSATHVIDLIPDLDDGFKSNKSKLIKPVRRRKNDLYPYKSHSKNSDSQDSATLDNDHNSEPDLDKHFQPKRSKLYLPSRKRTDDRNNSKSNNKNSSTSSQDSITLDNDADSDDESRPNRAKLILPNRRKKEDTNTNNNDDKLEDAERTKIMRRLEKTQQKEKKIVFTCPFCLIPFNHITKAIKKELDLIQEKEDKYKRKAKEEAKQSSFKKPDELIKRPVPSIEKVTFCRLHNNELVVKPTGIKNGYPVNLNFGELKERIMKLTLELDDVVYKKIPSDYRKVVIDAYDSLGKNKARTPMMMMNRIELLSPGYYGPRGAAIMLDVLSDIYLKSGRLSKQLTHPQMPLEFIQQVLIPETAYRLIRQDIIRNQRLTGNGKPLANANAKAKTIMLESCYFGEAMYPLIEDKEDLIDDNTYQQQLEREQKRKNNNYAIVIDD